ncbi:hypothetical protein O3P69_009906 [Scylla paramamosain]|uniref:Heme-binding protein n=2 Tax=Scylla paramamosain TaxID=85552 RepID=A0AAW0SR25_SCYPA
MKLKQTEGLEERRIPAKTWVCTNQPPADDPESSQLTVFLRLFGYLDGENNKGERLPMGIPVSIEATGTQENRNLTACFFLPEKVQIDPPTPTDPTVTLLHRPSLTILTRQFGGYPNSEATWDAETDKLKTLVSSAGISIDPNLVFWNAYDPPLKFWNRRNEVWLVKT